MGKRGPAPLPADVARSVMLSLRVTPAEKVAITQAASVAGLTVTAYLVGLALGDQFGGLIKGEGFTPFSASKSEKEKG